MWISHYGRPLNLPEKCRLQGMDPRRLEVVVSDTEFAKQLGNTMSVNVLERILVAALPAAGWTAPLHDRWACDDTSQPWRHRATASCGQVDGAGFPLLSTRLQLSCECPALCRERLGELQ